MLRRETSTAGRGQRLRYDGAHRTAAFCHSLLRRATMTPDANPLRDRASEPGSQHHPVAAELVTDAWASGGSASPTVERPRLSAEDDAQIGPYATEAPRLPPT